MVGDQVRAILLGCPCPCVMIAVATYGMWRLIRWADRSVGTRRRKS